VSVICTSHGALKIESIYNVYNIFLLTFFQFILRSFEKLWTFIQAEKLRYYNYISKFKEFEVNLTAKITFHIRPGNKPSAFKVFVS